MSLAAQDLIELLRLAQGGAGAARAEPESNPFFVRSIVDASRASCIVPA
ncbi:hypothetical protein [Burkholderia pseudomallei]|nr:hypothetical protein [Burkholderia pseudomallei]